MVRGAVSVSVQTGVKLESLLLRSEAFERDAHQILARFETSTIARVMNVIETKKALAELSLFQDRLFSEALDCISFGLYRPAIVTGFQAFMDCVDHRIGQPSMTKLHELYPTWVKHKSMEELRENVGEHQRLEAARKLNVISKSEMKALHGYLSIRNDCAHPTKYSPSLNSALGLVTDLIERAGSLLAE